MSTPKRGPGRPRGRTDTRAVLLPLSPGLLVEVDKAVEAAGLTRVEWMRRAVAYCVAVKVRLAVDPTGLARNET